MSSTIRIAWSREFENGKLWNEVCAWAVERFGLPGDRFTTHPCVDYMDFVFVNNKDAMIFAIKWNGSFVSEQELAVEAVGRLIN
jgi:hypothetical protein